MSVHAPTGCISQRAQASKLVGFSGKKFVQCITPLLPDLLKILQMRILHVGSFTRSNMLKFLDKLRCKLFLPYCQKRRPQAVYSDSSRRRTNRYTRRRQYAGSQLP